MIDDFASVRIVAELDVPHIESTADVEVRTLTHPGMPPGSFVFSTFVGDEVAQHEASTAAAVVALLMRVDAWHEEASIQRVELTFPEPK